MALVPKKQRSLPGGVLLIVLCLLSFVLMTVWTKEGDNGVLHRTKAGIEVIVMPLQTAGSVVFTPVRAIGDMFNNNSTDAQTVDDLRKQNEEFRSQLIRMEEYKQENERLSLLFDLKDAYNLEAVGARVISSHSDSWQRIITINKGSAAGLEVGMPVMSANGLIGQIDSVSPFSAQVRLIVDKDSGVSAFLQSSRVEGIVSGSVDGVLYLDFIPLNVPVQPGDTVITSGAGGVYPKGIPIGEVATVTHNPSDTYQTITIQTFTRVSSYEEVLVIVGNEAEVSLQPDATPLSDMGGQR